MPDFLAEGTFRGSTNAPFLEVFWEIATPALSSADESCAADAWSDGQLTPLSSSLFSVVSDSTMGSESVSVSRACLARGVFSDGKTRFLGLLLTLDCGVNVLETCFRFEAAILDLRR